ncbi:MAG: hypothetical protein CMH36_10285 [Microbacterium sp.]|uniref:PBP domain-containing protein n=1 Tax=Microbacterium ginsengisoli TaxID=400772 RepID=A0A0F0LUH8_9MICO|nr:hypothetical protein [Microbacterium ginsengisoli]KJL36379.1 hypothetical protein RR49_01711 [Microbacterium ginsengisoli]MAL07198.1 hypothetical protein [Microbacterium sp.]MBN9209082.1 hypothetical protein [Microbacterium ginsengisoli]HAN25713.1 hypothetical protein [Microbacterium ginsengisoli]
MSTAPRLHRQRWFASVASGLICGLVAFGATTAIGVASAPPAHAATDTSSAVTITAAQQDPDVADAPMPDLAVTVSQTQNLTSQGIRLTWTGGKKSIAPSAGGNGGENFLQVFMCWGDDPTDASRPDRTTCEYGGTGAVGATRDAFRNTALADIPTEDQAYSAPNSVPFLPPYTAIPFVSRKGDRVDGIKTDATTGKKTIDTSVDVNNNQFITSYSTNEIPWAGSGNDGSGSVSFEVQTAVQSDALGCGSPVTTGTTTTGASCWLVVLPRGTGDNGSVNITQSGLFIDSWRHALAVKLGFTPVGTRCPSGQVEKQLQGSELAALAVSSWQPVVCNQAGGSVYSLITEAESDAASQASTATDAPLALTSYPVSTDSGAADPLQYAPIALSGISISIAIDRFPNPNDKTVSQAYLDAARTAFTSINITPRLLAKLLTYSYRSAIPTGADTSYLKGTAVYNLTQDPDFLAVNDKEWAAQVLSGPAIADIIVPQGRSDAARAVWAYIAADKDASAFLAGKPDPWGMIVNPYFSTDASLNPNQVAFSTAREDFPKADPVTVTPANQGPINLITWRPFANDLASVAYLTLRGDGQLLGTWDPYSIPPKYGKGARMLPGVQRLIGLTSTSAAARYQVVTASLRNAAGSFVAPTSAGMLAAADAMTSVNSTGRTKLYDPASTTAASAPAAYPLTLPVYAANNPVTTSADLRKAYAAFIRYAVSSPAQTPGTQVGALPDGYAALPQSWVSQATDAATAIENGTAPTTPTTPTTPPAPTYVGSQPNVYNNAPAPVVGSSSSTSTTPDTSAPTPAASGTPSGALAAATTPADPAVGGIAAAVPASLAGALGCAIAFPVLGRFRRRL